MITGTHAILYSTDADADRAFLRDVLEFPHVDAGGGWLIFQLPPAELGVHPADGAPVQRALPDVRRPGRDTGRAGVQGRAHGGGAVEARWGVRAWIPLPSGATLGLYEPRHPVARDL